MQCIDELLRELVAGDVAGRIKAAEGLAAHAGDARVIPALRNALADSEDTAVTEAAMEALLAIGTTEAADALLDSLVSDGEETVEHLELFLDWAGGRGSALADEVLRRYREG